MKVNPGSPLEFAMSSDGSITHWINEIRSGNRDAAQALWERYFVRLVRLARSNLSANNRRVADEEDIALAVFENFCRSAENGRFPDLSDRDSLWRLLVRITCRKTADEARRQNRLRRGGGAVWSESNFPDQCHGNEQRLMAELVGNEPTPEFAAMLTEQVSRLMNLLENPELRALAAAKMEGLTNLEVADRMNCSERTIERRLKLIRERCKEELSD